MAYRIRRTNQKTGGDVTAPQQFATAGDAFDAAWDNMGQFLKNQHRGNSPGDVDGPPSAGSKYKIYIETRPNRGIGFHLRYDYPTGDPADPMNTNNITWRLIQI